MKIINVGYIGLKKYYGVNISDSYLGQMLKNNKADYYQVYDDNKFICDFWIYKENNSFCINKISLNKFSLFDNSELMTVILNYLKDKYSFITVMIDCLNNFRMQKALEYGFSEQKVLSIDDKQFVIYRKNFL